MQARPRRSTNSASLSRHWRRYGQLTTRSVSGLPGASPPSYLSWNRDWRCFVSRRGPSREIEERPNSRFVRRSALQRRKEGEQIARAGRLRQYARVGTPLGVCQEQASVSAHQYCLEAWSADRAHRRNRINAIFSATQVVVRDHDLEVVVLSNVAGGFSDAGSSAHAVSRALSSRRIALRTAASSSMSST